MGVRRFEMAEPVMRWRGQADPLNVFKDNGKKRGWKNRRTEKGGKPCKHHPAGWVCASETDSKPSQSCVNLGLQSRSDLAQAHSWLVGSEGPGPPASQQRWQFL